jgi:hypothetical protein
VLEAGVQRYAEDPEMWAIYFGFLWSLAADLPPAIEGIKHSWLRFGEPFHLALMEFYPLACTDPVVAQIWLLPRE